MNFKFITYYFVICFLAILIIVPKPKDSMILSKSNGVEQEYIPCDRDFFTDTISDRGVVFYIGYRINPVTLDRKEIIVYKKK